MVIRVPQYYLPVGLAQAEDLPHLSWRVVRTIYSILKLCGYWNIHSLGKLHQGITRLPFIGLSDLQSELTICVSESFNRPYHFGRSKLTLLYYG